MLTWPAVPVPAIPGRGGPVLVRDTSSGELTVAAEGPVARVYACGVTPYDATHLGHGATYVAFDLLVRAWRDSGLDVTYASNVTDVDDPLLERADATGVDWRELASQQTALFAEDMTALGVLPPDVYVGAVESIPAVVDAVELLLATGAAYRIEPEGDVYAAVTLVPGFGAVSGLDHETRLAQFAERGGDPQRAGKRDPLDALLWRTERPGEPAWDGRSLGRGRPGWHIECAVIARDGLGTPFDVQGGGSDLAFPHHEMSGAHLVALTGDVTARPRVHVHAGMVGLDGEKMSKSRGNLVLVSQLRADGVDPRAIRLALLAHHYASDWEWTHAELATAEARLETWRAATSGNGGPAAEPLLAELRAALAADLDAPRALAAVDAWAQHSLAGPADGGSWDVTDPATEGAPGVVARALDALLGIRL
ncbi:MAG: cysteine--1-D-myo-inosityl 2-amino-2-deoxy-alpha-D-glucopyranoside ligase [Actinomycetales bacterium]|nr:cysteine--1-D-myo-inosityl 2-amino-2-deoxy-alpha-D-glucopyranoside ligase [Actinomycetales bacterium]